jgi:hypothetical protein
MTSQTAQAQQIPGSPGSRVQAMICLQSSYAGVSDGNRAGRLVWDGKVRATLGGSTADKRLLATTLAGAERAGEGVVRVGG